MQSTATSLTSKSVELSAGTIHYKEIGEPAGTPNTETGVAVDVEVVVFVHGFAVDGQLWEGVAERLAAETGVRCIVPTWPFGSHTEAMRPDADLSPIGSARLIAEFLRELGLEDVTIVGNDSGGAVTQILVTTQPERIGRLILTNCDCFETFPPGVFKLMAKLTKLPGSPLVLANSMRFEPVLRAPFGFGALNKHRQPIELLRSFVQPLIDDPAIRRDAMRFFGSTDPSYTIEAAERLAGLDMPALIVWGEDDTFFPFRDAERLRDVIPGAKLVRVADAKTFVPLDQPEAVAGAIAEFVRAAPPPQR